VLSTTSLYAVAIGIISMNSHSWFWQEHVVSLKPLKPLPLLPLPPLFLLNYRGKGQLFFFKVLCTESTLCYGYYDSLLLILIHGAGKSMLFPTASAITACLSSVFLNTATRTLPGALASKVSLIPSCTVLLSPRCLISPVVRALRSRVAFAIKPSPLLFCRVSAVLCGLPVCHCSVHPWW
jgi:hypothetical protein